MSEQIARVQFEMPDPTLQPLPSEAGGRCQQLSERPGRKPVSVCFQLVIDCADPDRLAHFWAAALGYELAPAPAGFATWNDFYRELGVPEEDLVDEADRISDPNGHGPTIWFHVVPDSTTTGSQAQLWLVPWSFGHQRGSFLGHATYVSPQRVANNASVAPEPWIVAEPIQEAI